MKYFILLFLLCFTACSSNRVKVTNCQCVNNCLSKISNNTLECDVVNEPNNEVGNYRRGRF